MVGSFPTATSLSHLEHLHKLNLNGAINKLPDPHQFPPNLVKLTLRYSYLEADSIVKLGRLPNLKMLILAMEEEAMMKLKNLKIDRCPRLRMIPERFKRKMMNTDRS
ncbi:hypothetical protein Prudu_256S000500 [Prunus dulcis]|uniref:Uncharacterized protein n=1 Tax=Prunus dulcis TaxID=3755 RepID=A0A5H2Y4B8_PRUDU|nr:hypothetical protein Prudu_256S000500 [Prunus dulcis]